ncbi:MAG: hypothetical protein WA733_10665 [Methylocystis sp.]
MHSLLDEDGQGAWFLDLAVSGGVQRSQKTQRQPSATLMPRRLFLPQPHGLPAAVLGDELDALAKAEPEQHSTCEASLTEELDSDLWRGVFDSLPNFFDSIR